MSKILSITLEKPPVFIVRFDDGHETRLHSKIVWEYGLEVGMEVPRQQFLEMVTDAVKLRIHENALKYLNYHDYSAEELRQRLREDSRRNDLIDLEIEHLKDIKLLDDERFAERLAHKYVHIKKYGSRRALRELTRHGIDRFTAEDALQNYDGEYDENLRGLLASKHSRYLTDPKDRQAVSKVTAALLRYGYDPAEVRLAIKEYFTANDKPEE